MTITNQTSPHFAETLGGRSAGITLANLRGRLTTILFVPLGCTGAMAVAFDKPSWPKHAHVFAVVTYLAVIAVASIWLLYQGCRMGVRFDDHGVTVRKFLRTYRFGWPQVSRFEDGAVWSPADGWEWALAVVLRDGHVVTTQVVTLRAGWRTKPAILATVTAIQSAAQHGISAGMLTGRIVKLSDESVADSSGCRRGRRDPGPGPVSWPGVRPSPMARMSMLAVR